jgi:hypothetical protein
LEQQAQLTLFSSRLSHKSEEWNLYFRTLLLKMFDDVGYRLETVYSTNAILCALNAKQVANGGMGLNQPQSFSELGKFSVEFQQHLGSGQIDGRRS